jgi:hypothetical protein
MIMSLRSKPPAGVNPVMPVFAPETRGSAPKPASPPHPLSLRSTPLAFVDLGDFLSAPEASGSTRKPASPHRFVSAALQTAAILIGRDEACRVSARKAYARLRSVEDAYGKHVRQSTKSRRADS